MPKTRIEALKHLAKRGGGIITPAAVIEEARPESSPLHGSFTWDDTEAAEKYRVIEAQHLIREFTIVVKIENRKPITVPLFVGVSADRVGPARDNPYHIVTDVAKDADLLACAVADVLGQLKALKERHKHLTQLDKVWAAIEEALQA